MSIRAKVVAVVLVFLAPAAFGAYLGFKKFYFAKTPAAAPFGGEPRPDKSGRETPKLEEIKPPSAPQEVKPSAPKIPSSLKIYKNAEFGFEIQYPISWIVNQEINENIRGEMVKEFYFKKPNSDLRFAILPRDGLSYGVGATGTSTPVLMGGSSGIQTQYVLKDGRRLWLIFPQYRRYNWLEDLGRIDAMTSALDPDGDTRIFEQMLNSFKLSK